MIGSRRSAIGLELDGQVIRAVQVTHRRGGWCVSACAEVSVAPELSPTQRGTVVRGVLERQGFQGRIVHVAVPDRLLSLDLVERRTSGDAESAVRSSFARALKCREDAVEVCLWPTAALPGHSFAVALPHAAASELIRPLESAGLDVAGLFGGMSALAAMLPDSPETVAVVRCGWDANTLTLLHGVDVLYHRSLDTPGGLSADDLHELGRLSEELAATLACVPRSFGGLQVSRVLASGEPAETEEALNRLNQYLGHVEPLVPAGAADGHDLPASRFDVALGLALLTEAA